jgi:hypothetical protein
MVIEGDAGAASVASLEPRRVAVIPELVGNYTEKEVLFMNDNLPIRAPTLFSTRLDRRLARTLDHVDAQGLIAERADLVQIQRVAQATERGLAATAHISAVEAVVVQAVPHAEDRLRHIADAGAAGIARVVLRAGM